MLFVSEIETVSMTHILYRVRAINENYSLVIIVFLGEFSEKRMNENRGCCRLKQPIVAFSSLHWITVSLTT